MKKYLGLISVIGAGVCWGCISVFVRALTAAGFDSLEISLLRCAIASIVLFFYLLFTDKSKLRISVKDFWMFLGTGIVSLTFFSYCYFNSIVENGAAIAVVLLYTSPAFVIIMSALFLKEKITVKKIISLLITLLGCTLVAGIVGNGGAVSGQGLIFGILSGFGYALYSIFGTFAGRKYSSLTVTFYTILFSTLSLLFLTKPVEVVRRISISDWPYLIGVAIICTAIPYIAYTFGLQRMDAGKAAILVTVEPLVGCLFGIFAWKEDMSVTKIVGILLIFTAIIILSINNKNNEIDEVKE